MPPKQNRSEAVEKEEPCFGCTGLLESVIRQPLPPPSPGWGARHGAVGVSPVKWHPQNILVVPQLLLYHLTLIDGNGDTVRDEDDMCDSLAGGGKGEVPSAFGVALLLQTVSEGLARHWYSSASLSSLLAAHGENGRRRYREDEAALFDYVMRWHLRCRRRRDKRKRLDRKRTHEEPLDDHAPMKEDWEALESSGLDGEGTKSGGLSWCVPSYTLVGVKEGKTVEQYPRVSHRSVTLLGKDRQLNDIPIDHPSCSGQHAALQTSFSRLGWEEEALRLVGVCLDEMKEGKEEVDVLLGMMGEVVKQGQLRPYLHYLTSEEEEKDADKCQEKKEVEEEDWTLDVFLDKVLYPRLLKLVCGLGGVERAWGVELQLVDLGSTNGTVLNDDERLEPFVPCVLTEGDTIRFGMSTRRYVIIRST